MEIPVQFVKITKPIEENTIFNTDVLRYTQELPEEFKYVQYPITKTLENLRFTDELERELKYKTTQLPIDRTLETVPELKKWFHRIELENELIKNVLPEFTPRHVIVKVDPIRRVVIIKIDRPTLVTPFKRIIQVPEFINIHALKVKLLTGEKVILIKAPYLVTVPRTVAEKVVVPTTTNTITNVLPRQTELEMFRELEIEQLMRLEPTLYKTIKQMQMFLPPTMVVRCLRHLETGLIKVVLDVITHEFVQPENVLVKVAEPERTLVIRQIMAEKFLKKINEFTTFLPRQLHHEFILPKLFNIEKINYFKLNEKVLRIELPIVKEMLPVEVMPTINKW